jgi:uncharacterized protein YraI
MHFRKFALAAGVLLISASTAAAAVVTSPLNLRSGPSTRYSVIATMPPGARVDVLSCGGSWCRVAWHGARGYASASYLANGGAYAYEPAPVYVAPPPVVRFGYGWGGPRWRGHWSGGHGHSNYSHSGHHH